MTEQLWALTWTATSVLLPLIPSALLYRLLGSTGEVEGPWKGVKVKFGGAAAAYFAIFFVLIYARPRDANHYHTYVVRGQIEALPAADDAEPNLNDLFIRFTPPNLTVFNGGFFEWPIPVVEDTATGRLLFPTLQVDLRGYRGLSILLGGTTYGAQPIKILRDDRAKTLQIEDPLRLVSVRTGRAYSGGGGQP